MSEQQDFAARRASVKQELLKIYIASGDSPPANIDQMIDIWVDDLKDIPQNQISASFARARRENRRFKIIRAGMVLEAWEGLKGAFNRADWDPDRGRAQDNINRTALYTIENLPWCYVSNRHRELIRAFRAGRMTDEQAMEWEEVKKLRWRRKNLTLNESLTANIQKLENPEEMVNLSDLPEDVSKILENV